MGVVDTSREQITYHSLAIGRIFRLTMILCRKTTKCETFIYKSFILRKGNTIQWSVLSGSKQSQ